MKGKPMDPMLERIDKLERSVRRFKWAGGIAVSLALVALVMGQKAEPKDKAKVFGVDKIVAREVVAERYSLVDGGEVRSLWMTSGNEVVLMMTAPGNAACVAKAKDAESECGPSLMLGVDSDKSHFVMETLGRRSAYWKVNKDGSAVFTLLQRNDVPVGGGWAYMPSIGSTLTLKDKNGNDRVGLHSTSMGAGLALFDTGGTLRATMSTMNMETRPEAALVFYGKNGAIFHTVP